jgi:transposase-like protein
VAALRGDRTLSELASTFGIHPVQITRWKKQALAELPEVFGQRRDREAEDPQPRHRVVTVVALYDLEGDRAWCSA